MNKIPEILLKCCGKTYKPHSIKILDDCVRIIFFCPICRNWIYLESRDGMKEMLSKINLNKQSQRLPYRYVKNNNKLKRSK